LARDTSVKVHNIVGPQAIYILINSCLETNPDTGAPNPFRDIKVRQAMSYAIDVDGIIKNLLTGSESRHAGLPPNQPFADYNSLTFYPYDVAKAKQLMAEAGYANGLPGTYDITVPTGRWTASGEVTELVTTQLRAIGINARMRPAEYQPVTVGIQNHTMWPMAFFGVFSNLDSNISGGMIGGHTAGGNTCEGRWNMNQQDPEISALAKKAAETIDEKERAAIITQAFKIWGDKAYTINLYANSVSHVLRSDYSWEPLKAESTSVYNPAPIIPRVVRQ
jgi:peptide/nickel transport system substrate-binding protein